MSFILRLVRHLTGWSEKNEIDLTNYEKIKQIGNGGYGRVYLVQNTKDKQKYAAKVSKITNDDVKNFVRELDILSKIRHRTILPFKGYSLTDFSGEQNPIILTKYASNGSLRDALKNESLGLSPEDWNNTKKHIILYGIAKGMDYIHKKHFIHRDLKPENILLDENLYPQIADFGLSKWYDSDDTSQTQGCGTAAYMAPEIFLGTKYDQSVDVYSYSLIMYEVITGKVAFQNFSTSFQLQKKVSDGYRPEFPFEMEINEDVKDLIQRCWSGEPSERPSFEEIADFLMNEDIISSFDVDINEFYDYIDEVNENQDSSNTNKVVDIGRKKVDENDDSKLFHIYPSSQFVFLDSSCQNLVKSAEKGDSIMMVAVADSLIKGTHGFTKNVETGVKFLKKAAELDNTEALEMYASMLVKGDVIPSDLEKARKIVEILTQKDSPKAKLMWAQIELTNPNADYQKVGEFLKKSAADGDVEAMVLYAKFCQIKNEDAKKEPNLNEAMKFFKLAADSGNQEAKIIYDDFIKLKEEDKKHTEEERIKKEIEEKKRREINMTHYFPRCNGNSNSIVDSLKSIGVDSSFGNRNRIANRNGISNYSGTASQNVHLLSLLKQGQLIQP